MNKAWRVFYYEFIQNIQRRSYLLVTFAIPLLVYVAANFLPGLLAGGGNSGGLVPGPGALDSFSGDKVLGVVDQSGFVDVPQSGSKFAERMEFYEDEAAAQEALNAGEIKSYVVIASDYLETGQVYRYAEQFDLLGGLIDDQRLVRNYLLKRLLALEQDEQSDLYLRLVDPVNFDVTVIERADGAEAEGGEAVASSQTLLSEGAKFLLPYVFGIVMMLGTLFSSGYLMNSITNDKENRVIEIILSSVKPFPLLVGKVLAAGVLGLVQLSVYMFTLKLLAPEISTQFADLAGLTVPPDLIVIALAYFILGYFMTGGIYASIASIVERLQDASQFAGFMVLPMVFPIMLIGQFAEAPNGPIAVILSLFPLTSPLAMVMRVSIGDVATAEIVLSMALLALSAVGSVWFASRLFRVNTLLAGQSPSLRDVWRLVREDT